MYGDIFHGENHTLTDHEATDKTNGEIWKAQACKSTPRYAKRAAPILSHFLPHLGNGKKEINQVVAEITSSIRAKPFNEYAEFKSIPKNITLYLPFKFIVQFNQNSSLAVYFTSRGMRAIIECWRLDT